MARQLDDLQERLHAQRKRQRVLVVLQGMDTSGKDGTIRAVFHEVDPLGLRIVPFGRRRPTKLAHDFLWRVHAQAPAGGRADNLQSQPLRRPAGADRARRDRRRTHASARCRHIRATSSELLADSGTTIIKCMLHISKDEQRERLQARIDDPTKHWKFDVSDLDAASSGTSIRHAYRDALAATSTEYAPWYVIPADSKTHRNVMVAELLLRTFEALKLEFPPRERNR